MCWEGDRGGMELIAYCRGCKLVMFVYNEYVMGYCMHIVLKIHPPRKIGFRGGWIFETSMHNGGR